MQVLLPKLGATVRLPQVLPKPVLPGALEISSFLCLQLFDGPRPTLGS